MLNDVRQPYSSLLRIAPLTAFNPAAGTFLGQLKDASGKVITNPGLWALVFGSDGAGDPNTLYFHSKFKRRNHGLFAISPHN